jgi:uncharacterized membrane protein
MSSPGRSVTIRTAVAAGSALLAVAAVLGDVGSPVQPVLVFWFVLVCPGLAFAGLAHPSSVSFSLAFSVAVSCALAAVVAQVMLYAGVWNPLTGLIALAEITVVGCAIDLVVDGRARRPTTGSRGD